MMNEFNCYCGASFDGNGDCPNYCEGPTLNEIRFRTVTGSLYAVDIAARVFTRYSEIPVPNHPHARYFSEAPYDTITPIEVGRGVIVDMSDGTMLRTTRVEEIL
jgi:hypothetical protein